MLTTVAARCANQIVDIPAPNSSTRDAGVSNRLITLVARYDSQGTARCLPVETRSAQSTAISGKYRKLVGGIAFPFRSWKRVFRGPWPRIKVLSALPNTSGQILGRAVGRLLLLQQVDKRTNPGSPPSWAGQGPAVRGPSFGPIME